ncbi:hypothetical protein RHMOL_Rhmol10G0160700 [Rhododendron molle]|uniref:Uncharacterized protein n=1 Tax=Rhododendron molle TaxID=49168 RepID=A0ACC0M2P3_RHOML|nr:hypothetical protein RHMOL_Rhmol10G0160700 [Rhododendron molle]
MPKASALATNLGVLARDGSLLPLHYTDWRYVPAHYKKRVWEEIKDKDDGKNPTRIDTFIKTHTRKGGEAVNEETSAIVNKLNALRSQNGSSSHSMSEGAIFSQAIGPERPGRTRGLGLGATKSKLLGAMNNDQPLSQSSTERDREFMKMKSKVQKMKRFLEAMGYTDDTDDDSDEFNAAPNENHPDASSAHCEMTIGNNQASPEEINLAHRSQPEPTPFQRPNQQADSHHQCEIILTKLPTLFITIGKYSRSLHDAFHCLCHQARWFVEVKDGVQSSGYLTISVSWELITSITCFNDWKMLLTLALPSCVSVCLEWWWYELMIVLAGLLPNAAEVVATMGILLQATSLLYIFPSALSLAVSTRVGNELVRNGWGGVYTVDGSILAATAVVMPVAALCEVGNCPQTAGSGVLRGSARPASAANINLGSFYEVGLPIAIVMGLEMDMGLEGLWLGLLAAQVVCAVLMVFVLMRTDWVQEANRGRELIGI